MTQSFGQFIVNDLLPPELQTSGVLDKGELHSKLYEYARKNPGDAAKRMDKLRELGHGIATTEGISITLDDITPDYETRNAIIRPALEQMKKTGDPQKRQQIINAAQDKMLAATKKLGGSQGLFMRSGGRGKPVQLMRMSMAPMAGRTDTGDPYPWLVHHSHSEGLRPSEMFATNIETRNNQIASYKQVTEPGDFSKILVSNMSDQMVLEEDCGTTNGIEMRTDDPHIVDRYLARSESGFTAGTLITPQIASRLRKKRGTVLVRSPMTCELNDGICQKCYGLDEKGQPHTLGTNVGVRSAQAITEPLTQFQLSAKHGVRQAGLDRSKIQGLAGLRNFLEIPKTFTNKAVLATERGNVKRIEAAPQGGYRIYVGDTEHYTPPHLEPIVRKGDTVTPGDALSEGVPMPNEIVQHKGMGAGRKYLTERLHDLYKGQGVDVDKRHLEILARSHLNHVQVDHDPENRYFPGEVINYPGLMKQLSEDTRSVVPKKAEGEVLAKGHLHHVAGTKVTPEIAKELARSGLKRVTVARKAPEVSFIMRPITRNPLLNPDWLARMGHRHLKDSILEGAHYGQRSEIHSTHPIPAYVYGAAFGTGRGRRY
jgi:DNA-directed RNA polymerase subunit beta'